MDVSVAAALAALFGLIIGSFVNVVAYRIPAGKSVVSPPSACPSCDHPIRNRDNIPVVSWLLLKGRCRDCRAAISIRYPIVEATTGALFAVTVLVIGLEAIRRLQRTTFIIQYLFFLRCPLLIAIAMVILPVFAGEDDPKVLQNLFELDPVGLAITTWLLVLLAWAVMHTAGVLYVHVAIRNHLPFLRSDHKKLGDSDDLSLVVGNEIPGWLKFLRLPIFALLAI